MLVNGYDDTGLGFFPKWDALLSRNTSLAVASAVAHAWVVRESDREQRGKLKRLKVNNPHCFASIPTPPNIETPVPASIIYEAARIEAMLSNHPEIWDRPYAWARIMNVIFFTPGNTLWETTPAKSVLPPETVWRQLAEKQLARNLVFTHEHKEHLVLDLRIRLRGMFTYLETGELIQPEHFCTRHFEALTTIDPRLINFAA